jgi:hypothetical protein
MSMRQDEVVIEAFIKRHGVTRCPMAAAAAPTEGFTGSDRNDPAARWLAKHDKASRKASRRTGKRRSRS